MDAIWTWSRSEVGWSFQGGEVYTRNLDITIIDSNISGEVSYQLYAGSFLAGKAAAAFDASLEITAGAEV